MRSGRCDNAQKNSETLEDALTPMAEVVRDRDFSTAHFSVWQRASQRRETGSSSVGHVSPGPRREGIVVERQIESNGCIRIVCLCEAIEQV